MSKISDIPREGLIAVIRKLKGENKKLKEQNESLFRKIGNTDHKVDKLFAEIKGKDLIDNVKLEMFYIDTLRKEYDCEHCNAFKKSEDFEKLKNLHTYLGLTYKRFQLVESRMDWADLVSNSRDFRGYSDSELTSGGLNDLYAFGKFVNAVPALELTITYYPKKIENFRNPNSNEKSISAKSNKAIIFRRIKGLGITRKTVIDNEEFEKYVIFAFSRVMNIFYELITGEKKEEISLRDIPTLNEPTMKGVQKKAIWND